jgi:sec-independent protein translocase protein TatA
MFGSIGFTELILILFIVLIIFGAGKLPQLGEGLGKAIKGFKKSVHEAEAVEADPQAHATTQVENPSQGPTQVSGQTQVSMPEPQVAAPPSKA